MFHIEDLGYFIINNVHGIRFKHIPQFKMIQIQVGINSPVAFEDIDNVMRWSEQYHRIEMDAHNHYQIYMAQQAIAAMIPLYGDLSIDARFETEFGCHWVARLAKFVGGVAEAYNELYEAQEAA